MATKTENERIAVLETTVESLVVCVEKQTETIQELTSALNKGKGVLATISFLLGSSLIGAITVITGWISK